MLKIYDMGLTALLLLSEGRHAEDFFALKNPTASAGFEPVNLGTKGQHATSRPPKPLGPTLTCCYVQGSVFADRDNPLSPRNCDGIGGFPLYAYDIRLRVSIQLTPFKHGYKIITFSDALKLSFMTKHLG